MERSCARREPRDPRRGSIPGDRRPGDFRLRRKPLPRPGHGLGQRARPGTRHVGQQAAALRGPVRGELRSLRGDSDPAPDRATPHTSRVRVRVRTGGASRARTARRGRGCLGDGPGELDGAASGRDPTVLFGGLLRAPARARSLFCARPRATGPTPSLGEHAPFGRGARTRHAVPAKRPRARADRSSSTQRSLAPAAGPPRALSSRSASSARSRRSSSTSRPKARSPGRSTGPGPIRARSRRLRRASSSGRGSPTCGEPHRPTWRSWCSAPWAFSLSGTTS